MSNVSNRFCQQVTCHNFSLVSLVMLRYIKLSDSSKRRVSSAFLSLEIVTRGRETPIEDHRSSGFWGLCSGVATLPCKKGATITQTIPKWRRVANFSFHSIGVGIFTRLFNYFIIADENLRAAIILVTLFIIFTKQRMIKS